MIYTVTLNPALDRTLTIPGFAAGKVNRVLSYRDDPGGKGINVSKTVAALGGKSVAMGILGGGTGVYIKSMLDEMGILCSFETVESETRTNIKISDPQSGSTTDINNKGEIDADAAERVLLKALNTFRQGDICVLAGKLDNAKMDVERWIRLLNTKGVVTMLDTEGEALKAGMKAHPAVIKPNEEEFSQIASLQGKDIADLARTAMETAKEFGIQTLAVSMGERGALFAKENQVLIGDGLAVNAVCTVGAGDAMLAALAYGMDSGMTEEDTFALSIAASAAAVTCLGTQSPTREKIDYLFKNVKIRRLL